MFRQTKRKSSDTPALMAQNERNHRNRSVTMRDVAKAAHVSQSTVSRVLSGASGRVPISDDTKQRVMDAVEELGYFRNIHAGSLRGQRTEMLAMMVADIANPFFHPMVRAVQDVARKHAYDVMLSNTDHQAEGEMQFCDSIMRRPVDAVVMAPYHLTTDDIQRLIDRTGAVVSALGQHVEHPMVDVVYARDDLATANAVRWLIREKRHERIGLIGVADSVAAGYRRQRAFLDTIEEEGVELRPGYLQQGDWTMESGMSAMASLLDLPVPPTVVLALNDIMAIGAMDTAWRRGLRIPDDVAVVGFDNIPASSLVRPKLTTIAQNPSQMGQVMAEAVFDRLDGYTGPGRRQETQMRLIEREST